jgi:hypothetical protein
MTPDKFVTRIDPVGAEACSPEVNVPTLKGYWSPDMAGSPLTASSIGCVAVPAEAVYRRNVTKMSPPTSVTDRPDVAAKVIGTPCVSVIPAGLLENVCCDVVRTRHAPEASTT